MESLWSRQTKIAERRSLTSDLETEVVVIGAGMAGLLTAFFLEKRGKEVVVLEGGRIASGQTKNTTAKITSQHGAIYDCLIRKIGAEKAKMYAAANENAIREYQRIIEENHFKCGFEVLPSYLYSRLDEESMKHEAEAASQLGISAFFTKQNELPFPVAGSVCFENQAQFHPMEFVKQISEGLKIYEKTQVISVKGHMVQTEQGTVKAEHIIFATHYPFINIPGFYFLRQHQERSYVLALTGAERYRAMYYGVEQGDFSFRNDGDILLFGGGAHRTGGKNCDGIYQMLAAQAEKYFPNCREEARWSAQDCMSHDNIPFIGRYSAFRPYWYVASGFKKWGMTSSMIAAKIITEQICEGKSPYEEVFSPQRLFLRASAKNFIKDAGNSVQGLVAGAFQPQSRCPHMGCRLIWNPNERSWDCPCHGSRFEADGKLIDNPAQKGKIKS